MTDPHAIRQALETLGMDISEDEAQRLSSPLQALLHDLQKLDVLDDKLGDPTPRFRVEIPED